jgi:outer membrane autotransporter protein
MGAHLACGQLSQRDSAEGLQRNDLLACEPEDQQAKLWGAAFGYFGEQGNVQGFEGYDSDILGGMIAYDALVSDTSRAGLGVRYARSSLDGKASDSQTDIKSYQLAAYLAYTPGNWFANATLVYGIDRYEGSRHVMFPGVDATVLSKFKGHQYTASGVAGHNFNFADGLTVLTPQVSLQYTRLHTKGYTETGADAINLRVNAKTYEFTQAGLGAKLARSMPLSGRQVMRPDLHVNWLHSLGGETMSNVAAFASGGPAFLTTGLKPKRDTFNVGTGVVFANGGAWSVEGVYDYQWRTDSYKAHQAMIKFAVRL